MATHKLKVLCARCGGFYYKEQPSADAGAQVPAPPDFIAALRAARTEPQRLSILAQPALPTESSIVALNAADTVPSPAFETLRDSLIAFRDGLTKKWRK